MIGKQDGVVILNEGQNGLGEGLGSRRFVARDGSGADEDFVFGDQANGRGGAGDGKGRGMGRVAMDNGARKALIPLENKRNFLEVSGDIVERVDPVFFSDPMTAAMKALGMT